MKKVLPIILIVLLAAVAIYVFVSQKNSGELSYVFLTINPEVELGVDSDNIVKEVNPLNEDADVLLSDMDLIGKPIEDVTEEIIDSTEEIGMLQNNIELMVMNASEDTRLSLENVIKTKIEAHIQEKNYNATLTVKSVTEDIKTAADEYEISYGKMLIISKAVELNPELNEEELVEMEMKEIQGHIKSAVEERHEEANQNKEQLKETWENQKQELKSEHMENNQKENSSQEQNQEQNGTTQQNNQQESGSGSPNQNNR